MQGRDGDCLQVGSDQGPCLRRGPLRSEFRSHSSRKQSEGAGVSVLSSDGALPRARGLEQRSKPSSGMGELVPGAPWVLRDPLGCGLWGLDSRASQALGSVSSLRRLPRKEGYTVKEKWKRAYCVPQVTAGALLWPWSARLSGTVCIAGALEESPSQWSSPWGCGMTRQHSACKASALCPRWVCSRS